MRGQEQDKFTVAAIQNVRIDKSARFKFCQRPEGNSTQRKYRENLHREITTANWGLATTNQPS